MEQLNGHDQEAVNGSNNSMTAFFARYRAFYSIYIVKKTLYTVEKGAYIVKERVSSWKTALQ